MDNVTLSNQNLEPSIITTTPSASTLDSLFNNVQSLLSEAALSKQGPLDEASDLNKSVEYLASQDGLKKELASLQRREETRMNHIQQQNVLLGLRKEKIPGAGGYSRNLDDVSQVRARKRNSNLDAALDDTLLSEKRLFSLNQNDENDIARVSSASPDFNETFHQHSLAYENDEVLLFDLEEVDDPKKGEPHSLVKEIEKRIERIGQFINKKPMPTPKLPIAKAFSIPRTKSVKRLRSKFGKR